jgi:hypothetical protein
MKVLSTPWVRDYLAGHPNEAMSVESLRLNTPSTEGYPLLLSGDSARGPWHARINDSFGQGHTVLDAVKRVLATEAAA